MLAFCLESTNICLQVENILKNITLYKGGYYVIICLVAHCSAPEIGTCVLGQF